MDFQLRLILTCLLWMGLIVWSTNAMAGVCYYSQRTANSYTSYYRAYETQYYSTKCGFLGWRRCYRSRRISRQRSTHHPAVYAQRSRCCQRYSGSPPNCNPICTNRCIHGSCTSPDRCTCRANWRGSTCRDDSNLIAWCTSIRNRNINNVYQRRIRASLNVYCGPVTSSRSIRFNKPSTSAVAPKIRADANRCTTSSHRLALYNLWQEHSAVRGHCCISDNDYYITLLQSLMRYDSSFYQLIGCLTSTKAVELRKELDRVCSGSLSDRFCPIKAALGIIDLSAKLPSNKARWTSQTRDFKTAILVHYAVLKRNHRTEFSSLVVDEKAIVVDCTNAILRLVRAKNVANVESFTKYLPANMALDNSPETCTTDNLCLLMKIIEQVRLYVDHANTDANPPIVNGRKRLTLNTAVDYREFLKQKQLDRILTVLSELRYSSIQIANDLKKHATTQFAELRSYFESIETFNQQIAEADINAIDGRISRYRDSVEDILEVMERDMVYLILQTGLGAALNIAEKVVVLAMEIASAFNPLKWLTGGTSAKDILKATADLANAIVDVVELVSLSIAFTKLTEKTTQLATAIESNDDFLQDVKTLVYSKTATREEFAQSRDSFLQNYTDYTPGFLRPEIAEVGALWGGVVSAACGIVDGFDTAAASPVKAWVYAEGYCINLPKEIAKLVSTYEEIYDFQFALLNSMASYVRASVALDGAKEINTEFTELTKLDVNQDSTLTTLQIMGALTYVSYVDQMIHAVNLYCNVLEYKDRGVRPAECKGVNTNVPQLLAATPPTCRSSTIQFYHIPGNGTDKSYIDLDDLFAGKEVSFKVPSADWLVDNHWILPSERNNTFYVKRFEVYLPTKPGVPTKFITTAIPSIHNEITPGTDSTEYILVPNPHMVYEYMSGPSRLYCHDPTIKNPYTSCETSDVSEICELSLNVHQRLYPSLYSQWSITVESGEKLTAPKPATDMSVIIGLQLCKLAAGDQTPEDSSVVIQEINSQCCDSGMYRPMFNSPECESCPTNSTSALAGYYCEKGSSY